MKSRTGAGGRSGDLGLHQPVAGRAGGRQCRKGLPEDRQRRRLLDGRSRVVIDDAWLNGAELVRVQSRYAGHVSRSLTIDGFKMIQ